jgi:putative transposase
MLGIEPRGPNELWCADYKGQFRLGNGQYCYPLTITDRFSRFLLGCKALRASRRIEPAHPEQNSQHERMHLVLKQQTTRPAAPTLLQQQERFDHFIEEYNGERPHEALGQTPPAQHHTCSPRAYPARVAELTYPLHDRTCVLSTQGHRQMGGRHRNYFVSTALAGEPVGIREIDDRVWLVSYADLDLGEIDDRQHRFKPYDPIDPRQDSAAE